jgi:hypothetical protein
MTNPVAEITPESQRGWDAALVAARTWHESEAKKSLIQAKTQQVPKELRAGSRSPSEVRRDDHHAESRRRLTVGQSAA